jgi:hypothetical protein
VGIKYCILGIPFGIPLTGGDAGATSLSFFLGARFGSLDVLGLVQGAVNLGGAILDNAREKQNKGRVYYETFLPNIAYTTEKNEDGGTDLLVYNILSVFIDVLFPKATDDKTGAEVRNIFVKKKYDENGEEIPNPIANTGAQRVKNFDMANSSRQTITGRARAAAIAADNDNTSNTWRAATIDMNRRCG